MDKSKFLITLAFIFTALGAIFIFQNQQSGELRLIFCDVGQGDGMLIISPGGHEAVVDAGAGGKMSGCLSKYMPYWDRTVELIVPTHAHQEHMEGFLDIFNKYQIKNILTTNVPNDTQFYREWQKEVAAEGAKVVEPTADNVVLLDPEKGQASAKFEVIYPTNQKVLGWKSNIPADLNDASIVMRLTYGDFCAYLTGDLPKETLEPLIDKPCQVLKVVHHGSRTGTSARLLEEISPKLAVIQVGRDNKYGHPHLEVLNQLSQHNIKILRNDQSGTIEVDSNGKSWNVVN
ncbi:MAG TPA: MBL fold metallo-hydrolase [Candidatus Saccharimonadales bacterium]|nr:MBL fold metallo-hydrolase [Candidatus Saccharimonadales bacterium]